MLGTVNPAAILHVFNGQVERIELRLDVIIFLRGDHEEALAFLCEITLYNETTLFAFAVG